MTTTQITWHRPADLLPDPETAVLVSLDVDGIRTSCEGSWNGEDWSDASELMLNPEHVTGWCDLPEGLAA